MTPILVFDGYDNVDPTASRFEFVLRRQTENLRDCNQMMNSRINRKYSSQLDTIVVLNVLKKLDIIYIHAMFEADDNCAYIANQLNCPLLSDDSDFFIFDVTQGVIPFYELQFDFDYDNYECSCASIELSQTHLKCEVTGSLSHPCATHSVRNCRSTT